jgi:hypothetical protein
MSRRRVSSVRPPPVVRPPPDHAATTAADRPSKSRPNRSAHVTDDNIAHRAYDLFEQRGGEHGHDVDDWLQAERDLRLAPRSTAA